MKKIILFLVFLLITIIPVNADSYPTNTEINISILSFEKDNRTYFNITLEGPYNKYDYFNKDNTTNLIEKISFLNIFNMTCNQTQEMELYMNCISYFNGTNYKDLYNNLTNNLTLCGSDLDSCNSIKGGCEIAKNQCINTDLPKAKNNDLSYGIGGGLLGALITFLIMRKLKSKADQMTKMTGGGRVSPKEIDMGDKGSFQQ